MNKARMALLRAQREKEPDDRPEARAITAFFLNYPRCHRLPVLEYNEHQGWWELAVGGLSNLETAAARQAMQEVTSIHTVVGDEAEYRFHKESGREYDDSHSTATPEAIETVREEVATMRQLGMWDSDILRGADRG